MKGRTSLISVLLIGVSAFSGASQSLTPRQAASSADEYAVYSVVIRERFAKPASKIAVIVNSMRSPSAMDFSSLSEHLPLSSDTFENYRTANKESYIVRRLFNQDLKYVLIEKRELESLFHTGDLEEEWKRFYKSYPGSGGYILFSRVGF